MRIGALPISQQLLGVDLKSSFRRWAKVYRRAVERADMAGAGLAANDFEADIQRGPFNTLLRPSTLIAPEPGGTMRRREFIAGLSGAAVSLPLTAHAQQAKLPTI